MDDRPRKSGSKILAHLRDNGAHLAIDGIVNFSLPLLIYDLAQKPWGDVDALLASSVPPITWSVVEFARRRRIDALSALVLAGIALSLLAFMGGGGVRFLQLREKLVTGLIGLVFLGSAAIGRPLFYELARAVKRRKSADEAEKFEKLRVHSGFRRTMTVMTLIFGGWLLADVAVSVVLVFELSIREYLIVNPIIGYAAIGGLGLSLFGYARLSKRRGEARRATEAARAAVGGARQESF